MQQSAKLRYHRAIARQSMPELKRLRSDFSRRISLLGATPAKALVEVGHCGAKLNTLFEMRDA